MCIRDRPTSHDLIIVSHREVIDRHAGVHAHERMHVARAIVGMRGTGECPGFVEILLSFIDAPSAEAQNARVDQQTWQKGLLLQRTCERNAASRLFHCRVPVSGRALVLNLYFVDSPALHLRVDAIEIEYKS